jgi:4-amino-4-deoxy-L-arabinose transferase-like glycosyltransferase
MLTISGLGQVLVWLGMDGMRRCRGWAFEGVLFYLWTGGVLGGLAAASTGVLAVVPIPLLAPAVATLAKRWTRSEDAA